MMKLLDDDHGVALILTILIISIIVSLTLQFHKSMWSELNAAEISQNRLKLHCIAKSGYNYAIAMLSEDLANNDFDSLHDNWADSGSISEDSASMFESGSFNLVIRDLSGRININDLVTPEGDFNLKQMDLLIRFLNSPEFNITEEEVTDIIDSIKDWIDPDNEVTRFGAESGYYESLENPYGCRNGPLQSIEELSLIKGITKELLFGGTDRPGIIDFLTIYGDGKINLNTAHPLVVKALSDDIDQEMIDSLIAYREEDEQGLNDKLWYKNALGTEEDLFDQEIISTKSNYFEIESSGIMNDMSSAIKSVVRREGGNFIVMRWKYL